MRTGLKSATFPTGRNGKMNRFSAIAFFVISLLSFQLRAGVRPDIKVTRIKTKVNYETSQPMTKCGPGATGCTSAALQYGISVNCRENKISITFGYPEITVQIINRLKKGSVDFDATLKHELTHVALREEITEKFYRPTASACLMQYERSAARTSSCEMIRADVEKIFFKYMKRLEQEVRRHDNMIDGFENYAYQSKQIQEKKIEQSAQTQQKKHSRAKEEKKYAKAVQDKKASLPKDAPVVTQIENDPIQTVASLPAENDPLSALSGRETDERETVLPERQAARKQSGTNVGKEKPVRRQVRTDVTDRFVADTVQILFTAAVEEFQIKEKWASLLRALLGDAEKVLTAGAKNQTKPAKEGQKAK